MRQPTLFEKRSGEGAMAEEQIVLYALGDFQARGKLLAGRDLPLDRLRGAFKRACEANGVEELSDESAVAALGALGANVRQVPSFVAKHPFRVVVSAQLAERAALVFREIVARSRQDG
ncbi:MAG TPA: hypothetical protein VGC89_14460 [Pyrinomonadaceae bacterium]